MQSLGLSFFYKGKPAYLAGRFTWKEASKSHTGEEEEERQKKKRYMNIRGRRSSPGEQRVMECLLARYGDVI
jgi:hypothetical protein